MKIHDKKKGSFKLSVLVTLLIPLVLFSLQFAFNKKRGTENKKSEKRAFESPTTISGSHSIENIL